MYLSWIIPSYNEERRIEKTIREVAVYLDSKKFSDGYEIIVSNSASTDRTSEIVEKLAKGLDCSASELVEEARTKSSSERDGELLDEATALIARVRSRL